MKAASPEDEFLVGFAGVGSGRIRLSFQTPRPPSIPLPLSLRDPRHSPSSSPLSMSFPLSVIPGPDRDQGAHAARAWVPALRCVPAGMTDRGWMPGSRLPPCIARLPLAFRHLSLLPPPSLPFSVIPGFDPGSRLTPTAPEIPALRCAPAGMTERGWRRGGGRLDVWSRQLVVRIGGEQ